MPFELGGAPRLSLQAVPCSCWELDGPGSSQDVFPGAKSSSVTLAHHPNPEDPLGHWHLALLCLPSAFQRLWTGTKSLLCKGRVGQGWSQTAKGPRTCQCVKGMP